MKFHENQRFKVVYELSSYHGCEGTIAGVITTGTDSTGIIYTIYMVELDEIGSRPFNASKLVHRSKFRDLNEEWCA